MPNDYITLKAIASELNLQLTDGRINKVNIDGATLILYIRSKGLNHTLLISAEPSKPGFYLTTLKPNNDDVPTAFCMLLRKHLTNATITSMQMLNNDRILALTFLAKDELRDSVNYTLVYEIMGGFSNIILIDNDNHIIDAYKRIFEATNGRTIIPYTEYVPPLKTKPPIDDAQLDSKISLTSIDSDVKLLESVSGLSRESACEIIERSKKSDLLTELKRFASIFDNESYNPSLYLKNGVIKDFCVLQYQTMTGDWVATKTLNDALSKYYEEIQLTDRKKKDAKEVIQLFKRHKAQISRKIKDAEEKLKREAEVDKLLQQAEILKCNIYRTKDLNGKIAKSITCFDYYNNEEIELPLDQKLTAKENFSSYYKKYTKLKGAVLYAKNDLEKLKLKNEYLNSIEVAIENCTLKEEYAEIKKELQDTMGLKRDLNVKKVSKKEKKTKPLNIIIEGFSVYIGKNNYQNDAVTFDIGSGRDIWLHVKNYHSAHGIIITEGREIPFSVISKAAQYVAEMSSARAADRVEVDYTFRKHVKKLGKPGLVTYTDYKTVQVKPMKFT
ncbi:MAG: NFACT family protein [Christensenellaceae bacterium]|jgi:predicted ribosome quality control (RQC) complex YloA/Tae2 family protein|nr:NFACT family protein [Christensenellaceae bacterium]